MKKPRILVSENAWHFGDLVSDYLKFDGFETGRCTDDIEEISAILRAEKYDGIILFVSDDFEHYFELIQRVRAEVPDIVIYATYGIDMPALHDLLYDSGATRALLLPVISYQFADYLREDIPAAADPVILPAIERFVESKKFPKNMQGFDCLCVALELALLSPRRLSNMTGELYPMTAERLNSTASIVESCMRKLVRKWIKNGDLPDNINPDKPPTNRDIIALLADEFTMRFLKTRRPIARNYDFNLKLKGYAEPLVVKIRKNSKKVTIINGLLLKNT